MKAHRWRTHNGHLYCEKCYLKKEWYVDIFCEETYHIGNEYDDYVPNMKTYKEFLAFKNKGLKNNDRA